MFINRNMKTDTTAYQELALWGALKFCGHVTNSATTDLFSNHVGRRHAQHGRETKHSCKLLSRFRNKSFDPWSHLALDQSTPNSLTEGQKVRSIHYSSLRAPFMAVWQLNRTQSSSTSKKWRCVYQMKRYGGSEHFAAKFGSKQFSHENNITP